MLSSLIGTLKAESNLLQNKIVCDSWIKVTSECGKVFYLCADRYSDFNELKDAALYYSDIKCN